MSSKSFYRDHGKDINEQVDKYESFQEKKDIKFNKCSHKDVKFVGNSLKCKCGAAWSGARLADLYELLVGGKYVG